MTQEGEPATTVDFGDVRVDLDARRLSRGGVEVPLEPKAYAVLAAMLARPGHAFSRDELLDAVWGHRHVTPGVLVRVVGLIRKALEDDQERWLQTVHGVGYRLVLTAGTGGEVATPAPVESTDATAGHTGNPSPAGQAPAASSRLPWLLALATIAILLAFVATRFRAPVSAPVTDIATAPAATAPSAVSAGNDAVAPATLAVLPLRALGDDPRGQDFADGLSEELITTLARIPGLRVSARSASFPHRETALQEVARQLGTSHVLEGSVRQDGDRLRISLRLVDVSADQALWTESFDRQFGDIFAVQADIARAVAEVLRLKLVLASDVPAEDPALYRQFLLARQLNVHASNDELAPAAAAEAAMRELVGANPGYARGWGGLAMLQYQRSLRPRAGREALLQEAESLAARALALDPGQSDALAVIAAQACREQRWSDCLSQSRRVVRLAPSDVGARQLLGLELASTGRLDEALAQVLEAVAIDPHSPSVQLVYGRLLDTLGRHGEARVALDQAVPVRARTARVLNALWRGDLAGARRICEAISIDDHFRASQLATIDALEDPRHWPRALAAIEASEVSPTPEGEHVTYNFMRLWLPERDYARDIAGLDRTQRLGFATYQLVFWQPESRTLRQSAEFQAYLHDSGLLAHWQTDGWPPICRPDGRDGARCD